MYIITFINHNTSIDLQYKFWSFYESYCHKYNYTYLLFNVTNFIVILLKINYGFLHILFYLQVTFLQINWPFLNILKTVHNTKTIFNLTNFEQQTQYLYIMVFIYHNKYDYITLLVEIGLITMSDILIINTTSSHMDKLKNFFLCF